MPARKVKLVEVLWVDAQDLPGDESWVSLEEIKTAIDSIKDLEHSSGYLLGKYKGFVVLAATKTKNPKDGTDWYSAVQLIPLGWVQKVTVIKNG